MEVKLNFTKVPNQLLRHQEGVSAMEKLFLIYLLSHKKGYQLSDVQTADNLGISRNTVSKLKEKLSQEGYITYRKDPSRGYLYSVHLEKIILQKSKNEESQKNDCSPEYVDIISAFKIGLEKFRDSKYYSQIIEKERISGNWHKTEYIVSQGDKKNILYFINKSETETINNLICALKDNLHMYLINQIFDETFFDYKTGKENTPTISFFLKGKKAYDNLLLDDYN